MNTTTRAQPTARDLPSTEKPSSSPASIPQPIESELDKAILKRRQAWTDDDAVKGVAAKYAPIGADGRPLAGHTWGLALSGGGIRSATFGLGLIRRLAKNELLLRFDLLSTVSGGGYVGATVGRLFSHAGNAANALRVQSALGDPVSRWYLLWLRANGRYLIPRGTKDTIFAFVVMLRSLLALHFEIGLIAIMLGLLLVGGDMAIWWALSEQAQEGTERFWRGMAYLSPLVPVPWFGAFLALAVALAVSSAYWNIPWIRRALTRLIIIWFAGWALLWFLFSGAEFLPHSDSPPYLYALFCVVRGLLLLWLAGVGLALLVYGIAWTGRGRHAPEELARHRLTSSLVFTAKIIVAFLVVGVVDRVAWSIAFDRNVLDVGLALAITAGILRACAPLASKLVPGTSGTISLILIARIIGLLLAFFLFAWWVSLVHKTVASGLFSPVGTTGITLSFGVARETWLYFVVPVCLYIVTTGRNFDFLNLSSLHAFYRARIARSYLGAANPQRFNFPDADHSSKLDPLAALKPVLTGGGANVLPYSVDQVVEEDNVSLDSYVPQKVGAPVHLINSCINQTTDPRGGLFNQDRRGLPLAVASGGLALVPGERWSRISGDESLTLAAWIAISGAAFASGLGSRTRGGIAALATFAGVRLGYWWRHDWRAAAFALATRRAESAEEERHPPKQKSKEASGTTRKGLRQLLNFRNKSNAILAEMTGTFAGGPNDDWFLTDGGHYDNTGAYALLAQRCEVIVLSDCGADPEYLFEDLENLVRRARIDLQAYISFQKPISGTTPWPADAQAIRDSFGSLRDLKSPDSSAYLALAKIQYAGESPSEGILILVKPNMCSGLSVDLVNFWEQNKTFPQQTTADQFFSEAQWESYFLLGYEQGKGLTPALITKLRYYSQVYFEADERPTLDEEARSPLSEVETLAPPSGTPPPDKPNSEGRIPPRSLLNAGAVSATIGLGAIATLSIGVWQTIDGARTASASKVAAQREALKDLTAKWAKVMHARDIEPIKAPEEMQTTLPAAAGVNDTSESLVKRQAAVSELAAALVHTADTLCPANEASWFIKSSFADAMLYTAQVECSYVFGASMAPESACGTLVRMRTGAGDSTIPRCLIRNDGRELGKELEQEVPASYWGYGYSAAATRLAELHPCDPRRAEKMERMGWYKWLKKRGLLSACRNVMLSESEEQALRNKSSVANGSGQENHGSPPSPPPPNAGSCKGITIYIQVYQQDQMVLAGMLKDSWIKKLGATVPDIEDVQTTAAHAGRSALSPIRQPSIRYPIVADGSKSAAEYLKCANAMVHEMAVPNPSFAPTGGWRLDQLPTSSKSTPKAIEVWIPPYWFALAPGSPSKPNPPTIAATGGER